MKGQTNCERCGTDCRIDASRKPDAKMLRHSNEPKGLCVNCAVHDWLRNTYPPNILLAQSGPRILLFPHIQKQFAEIMKVGSSDAKPDEIDWDRIVENWDLPFPKKIKPSGMNPCTQRELDEIAAGKRQGLGCMTTPDHKPLSETKMTITSFGELNELKAGLGDELKRCLHKESQ